MKNILWSRVLPLQRKILLGEWMFAPTHKFILVCVFTCTYEYRYGDKCTYIPFPFYSSNHLEET